MALSQNPQIVTNGLVFYYDMYNRNKSWRGEPTTNQFAIPTPDSNGNVSFAVNGTGTFKRIFSGSFGGYDIQPSDIVYRYDLGTNGCHYHGNDVTITSGQYPTFTFDYYLSPDVTSFSDTYMANFENLGSGISAGAYLPNLQKGVWQTIQINGGAASATSGLRMLLYPGGCSGSRLAATGYLLMKNPQVTFSSSSGRVLPFVAGTRSNTQAIYDLTGNNTWTVNNLSYASDGTFSFNGSNSSITSPTSSLFDSQSITMESWNKPSSTVYQNGFLFEKGQVNTQYSNFYNSDGTFYFRTMGLSPQDLTFFAPTYIAPGNWYHIACTVGSGLKTIYVNGIQITQTSYTGTIPTGQTNQYVGIYGGGGYPFLGQIAVSRVYNRALSASEIQQNFNAQRGLYGI